MNITVIVCTYNRCQSLSKALDSIAALILPDSIEWEVLIVDNNSKDHTRDVVEGFCHRHPGRFRYLYEPHQGKSHALNAGIQDARGKVLAFTDDDVTVERTWLRDLTAALHDDQWVGAGGRTLPDRMFSPPGWLPLQDKYALGPLAVFAPVLRPVKSTNPHSAITWRFESKCLRSTVASEPTWALVQAAKFATRTPSSTAACWMRESGFVTNPPPSSITQFRKAAFRRSISWHGGSTRPALKSRNLDLSPRPSGTSQEFRYISSADWPFGPCDGQ